jgi:hypothetical protein
VQVPCCSWQSKALDEARYKLSGAVAKLASITFWSIGFFSTGLTYLGFVTEGKLAAIFIKPSLGVSNWPVIYFINYTPTSSLALFNTAPPPWSMEIRLPPLMTFMINYQLKTAINIHSRTLVIPSPLPSILHFVVVTLDTSPTYP